jgi:Asp-tRNA(Asn)/Glu-tRNA(Gln) amidotransferase A subunit family amidase
MVLDQISDCLSNRGLSASDDEVRGVATDLNRLSATLLRLKTGLDPSVESGAFARVLREAEEPRWPQVQTARDTELPGGSDVVADVDHALAQAEALGPPLNCFIEVFPQDAKHRARALEQSGPSREQVLYGVPFAYKDVFTAEDRAPTAGVGRGYRWEGQHQSRSLRRLARAGAVPVGALNLDPHCYTATGFNPYFGRVLNPHGSRFAVGGSSSGAAAAVASGIVPFALGTDTGGSVRIPASLCGVYGLKPTHGLVQDPGVVPLSGSHDTVGVLATSPALLARVLDVLAQWPRARGSNAEAGLPETSGLAKFTGNLKGLMIGINPVELFAGIDQDVSNALRGVQDAIERLGAELVEVPFPSMDDLNACASVLTSYEAIALHENTLSHHPEFYPDTVRRRLLTAACVSDEAYQSVRRLRGKYLADVLARTFRDVDVIICPTIRKAAPQVDQIADDGSEAGGLLSLEFLRMNRPFSFLGLPALSMPVARDSNGIPIGLQIIGRPFSDHQLLALGDVLGRNLSTLGEEREPAGIVTRSSHL